MRRRNRIAAGVLAAALLAAGLAPPAAAQGPRAPLGWLDAIERTIAGWWQALADEDGRRLFAAGEVSPSWDPNGHEVAPHWDPNGNEVAPEEDGNEVAPRWDPNG